MFFFATLLLVLSKHNWNGNYKSHSFVLLSSFSVNYHPFLFPCSASRPHIHNEVFKLKLDHSKFKLLQIVGPWRTTLYLLSKHHMASVVRKSHRHMNNTCTVILTAFWRETSPVDHDTALRGPKLITAQFCGQSRYFLMGKTIKPQSSDPCLFEWNA